MSGPSGAGALPPPTEIDDDEDGGLDLRALVDYAGYAWAALRRRAPLALAAALGVTALAGLATTVMPRRYRVEATLLAQNNQVIAALGNPSRAIPREDIAPTRAVAETVLKRDNLIAVARQTGLVAHWKNSRPWASRLRTALLRPFRRPWSDEEWLDILVFVLQDRMAAWSHDNKVTIAVTWDDPGMALRLVEAAQQNFLETRHVSDTAVIAESISILEGHLAVARREVDEALSVARDRRRAAVGTGEGARTTPAAPPEPEPDQELARQRILLESKRRAVRDLEDFRRRRLSELQAQLAEQRAVYAESHPMIVNLRQSLEALGQDSPQLAALRRETQALEENYVARGGRLADLDAEEAATPRFVPTLLAAGPREPSARRDPAEEFALSRVSAAATRYNVLVDRVAAARMELDAARAAFKYRYTVVQPPLPPKRALGPRRSLLVGLGALAGVLAGLFTALALELRQGLVRQAWQVRRQLGLPVLAELPRRG